MFKQSVVLAAVVIFSPIGCGDDGGGSGSAAGNHPPIAFNFLIATTVPNTTLPGNIHEVAVGAGGGGVMASGLLAFSDDDADVTTLRILESVVSPTGDVSEPTIQEEDIRDEWYGKSSGAIEFKRAVNTALTGGKSWIVSVVDEHGEQSNVVGGAVLVR